MTLNEVLERIPSRQWTLYRAWLDLKRKAHDEAVRRR